jgi:hypothetical protein
MHEGLENAMMLLLSYFFIISGWINYFKSIKINPHTHTKPSANFCYVLSCYEEFEAIAIRIIKRLHQNAIIQIASSVWKMGSKDIRDVLKIAM